MHEPEAFNMDILSSCYLFKGLSHQQIDVLAGIANEISVAEKTWLCHEGEAADKLYFLMDGAVELLTTIDNDIELPITKFRASGDCLGTGMLVEPFQYSLSARSHTSGPSVETARCFAAQPR